MDRNLLHLPVLTSYYLTAIWVSVYFKWWAMLDLRAMAYTLPVVFGAYIFVTAITNLQVLSPWISRLGSASCSMRTLTVRWLSSKIFCTAADC